MEYPTHIRTCTNAHKIKINIELVHSHGVVMGVAALGMVGSTAMNRKI
jgi:hypothetical protein